MLKTAVRVNDTGRPIKIGCDPEFELLDEGGRHVDAGNYYQMRGQIGTDAVTDILELRPFATEEPELLVNRIRNLIASVYYDRKRISVSGHRRALGGHIHISEVAPEASLVQMLDDFVGRYFVELSGDARGDFKELGQVAEKEHHGHGGFEYRTPPSAVFHNPRVTGIIMKLVKTLCEELRRGDIEYETDAAGRALPAEFEKRIGEDNARRLFEFVEMYNVQLRETRGTNTPIEIDVEGWRIPQSQIQLDMRDDWCEECREAVVDAINEVQQDPRFADCDARFMVFGMRADRGNRAY
jgi:hypothetical protein